MKALLYLVNNKEKILFLFYLIFIYYFIGACLFCNEKKRKSVHLNEQGSRKGPERDGEEENILRISCTKKNQFLIKKNLDKYCLNLRNNVYMFSNAYISSSHQYFLTHPHGVQKLHKQARHTLVSINSIFWIIDQNGSYLLKEGMWIFK